MSCASDVVNFMYHLGVVEGNWFSLSQDSLVSKSLLRLGALVGTFSVGLTYEREKRGALPI